jgi:hypothetical protein
VVRNIRRQPSKTDRLNTSGISYRKLVRLAPKKADSMESKIRRDSIDAEPTLAAREVCRIVERNIPTRVQVQSCLDSF